MSGSTHPADTSKDGGRVDMSRVAMRMALEALIAATPVKAKDPQMQADAIVALRAALAEQKCPCGDRQANQCPGEWEPGCDLGANAMHAKVAAQAQPVPHGRRMVPVEPTEAMLRAAQSAWLRDPARRTTTLYRAMLAASPEAPTPTAMQPLTARELELLDGMIEVQLHHAAQCDLMLARAGGNHIMAERQKGWDMERVELLRKIRSMGVQR